MAEDNDSSDESQKTEEPSARKLEEARKKGQVIYSREITNWVMLFAITLVFLISGPVVMRELSFSLKKFLEMPHVIAIEGPGLENTLQGLFIATIKDLLLPLSLLMVAGIASCFIQTGPILTTEPVKPKMSKISIIAGFGRLFSARAIMELIKSIFKLIIVTAAAYMALAPYFGDIEHFVGLDLNQSMFEMKDLFLKLMIAVLIVMFFVAIFDYLYQRHDFMKKMRMSKQELKDEYKQTEGDPHIKARLRELRQSRARKRMMQAVPTADVVITNPTHYAVALKYDTKAMDAPVMVAKGADIIAGKIKEIAKDSKVPIVENAPLARALFDSMEIDEMIPQTHWKAVAEVISYVFKLKGRKM